MKKNRCKELRGTRSQKDIASFLGVTQQQYSNIEKSKKPPKIEMCIKLSKVFNKPIDYIFPDIFLSNITSVTCNK
jgi:DNA-binding helix-turn-helix protein|nr:MAG TPA: putative transcriptional regulator [Caudoviricetes sp.]